MDTAKLVGMPLIFALAAISFAQNADKQIPTESPDYILSLHYGKDLELPKDATQALYAKTMEFLKSSNFNSSIPEWLDRWGLAAIHDHYRQTVVGNYLLVTFKHPQKINTVGGEAHVLEIVVGLNGQHLASSLYTIDEESRIVAHSKYNGTTGIELLDLVKHTANNP